MTECPACGQLTLLDTLEGVVVYLHGPSTASLCLGTFVPVPDALAVQRMRDEGGERLRLAAHP